MFLRCGAACGGGVWEGTVPFALLWAGFQSLPLLPTSKLGPSADDSQIGGFVYVLWPCRSLQQILLWGWEFLPLPQLPQVFLVRGFEVLFSHTGTMACVVCLTPQLFLQVYPHANVGLPTPPATTLPATVLLWVLSALAALLPVWMNVSFLIPWLSDFYTVWFSVNSGCFWLLNLLLSFFWLCEEAQCIYLCLHLGWDSYGTILRKNFFFSPVNFCFSLTTFNW